LDTSKLFYRSVNGIFEQGRPSFAIQNGKLIGQLRGFDDCKCALGHLIDDRFPICEGGLGTALPMIRLSNDGLYTPIKPIQVRMLKELEMLHDSLISKMENGVNVPLTNEEFTSKFMEKAAKIAEAYSLVYQP